MIAPEARLIDLALGATDSPTAVADALSGVEPDDLGLEGWQALTRLEALLEPESAWAVRVRSLRRRSHYAATIAAAKAGQISAALAAAGIPHAVFGELALATAYGLEPGSRAINYLSLWADPKVPWDELTAALTAVPDLRTPRGGDRLLRASIGGLAIGINHGWPATLGGQRGLLATPPVTLVTSEAGRYPIVSPAVEAYHLMLSTRSGTEGWLLDLRTIAAAAPGIWHELPGLAADGERSLTLRWAWEQAHARGAAPTPPRLSTDPPRAWLSQRLHGRPNTTGHGRLTPLVGEAAARPDHGLWPALFDVGLAVGRLWVGEKVTRIDDGGAALLDGPDPLILAANHQDHLDADPILVTTSTARRRRLRFVANEKVLAAFGTGQGIAGRGRAAVVRGIYGHVLRVIPIREHIRGRTAVAAMVDALAAGDTVVIYPEGVRNPGEELVRLRRGVALLAMETRVPIVPVRIDGTRTKLRTRHGLLVRTRPNVTVRYRQPIHVAAHDTEADVLSRLAAGLAPLSSEHGAVQREDLPTT